jgi:hypothetical protein
MPYLRVLSLNARKSNAATNDVASKANWEILCLQEPYVTKENVVQLKGAISSGQGNRKVRAAIVGRGVNVTLLPEFSDKDMCAVAIEGTNAWVASIYCDIRKNPCHEKLLPLIREVRRRNKSLTLAVDSNSHSVLWGSEKTNPRGEEWEDFIISQDLRVENSRFSLHTFENEQGHRSHIDVTITKGAMVSNWRVNDGPMVLDHREIQFDLLVGSEENEHTPERITFNHKKCNWTEFQREIDNKIRNMPRKTKRGSLNERANFLQKTMQEELAILSKEKKSKRKDCHLVERRVGCRQEDG